MTEDRLTEILAAQILGWKLAPGRFIKADRTWTPRWRFAPFSKIEDALLLLESSGGTLTLKATSSGDCKVEVRIASRRGDASDRSKARAIVTALVAALGLEESR